MSNTYPAQPTFFRFGANLPIYVTRVNHYDVVFKAQNRTSQYMNYHTCIHARTNFCQLRQIFARFFRFLQGKGVLWTPFLPWDLPERAVLDLCLYPNVEYIHFYNLNLVAKLRETLLEAKPLLSYTSYNTYICIIGSMYYL